MCSVYVLRQLGHSSADLTLDTYGKWMPMDNKIGVDQAPEVPKTPGTVSNVSAVEAIAEKPKR